MTVLCGTSCELKLNGLVSLIRARVAVAGGSFAIPVLTCIAADWTNTFQYAYVLTVRAYRSLCIMANISELLWLYTGMLSDF